MQNSLQDTRGGTRTHNFLLRRETPYPLGHTSDAMQSHTATVACHVFRCRPAEWTSRYRRDLRKKTQAKLASTILGACRAALASLGPDCKYHWDVHIASFWHVQFSNRQQYEQSSTTQSEIRNLNQKLCQAEGLLREVNPGPLAPEARIMPLDQAAVA